jgi:hypothetical protein
LNTSHVESTYEQTTSYDFKFEVIDLFNTASLQQIVSTSAVPMSLSETGVGIGKMHENGVLDVEGDMYINGSKILESGTNSNGYYIKYADGTMVCSHKLTITTTFSASNGFGSTSGTVYYGYENWVFPATFIADPVVVATNAYASGYLSPNAKVRNTTATSTAVSVAATPQGVDILIMLLSIGRWKA